MSMSEELYEKRKRFLSGFIVIYLFFEAEYVKGEVKISDEHTGFVWLDFSKIQLEKYFKSGNLEGIMMYLQLGSRN